jgi:hypothetical protein
LKGAGRIFRTTGGKNRGERKRADERDSMRFH